ncbi:non-homologous end-joining DNA ligase [Phyllobacterium endophyticum]|uniref:DNA ligase (ATP) n=1 Tax=Phyllobacterium endophyticum TaxID=1149773 RepID=A0A2P7AKA0_9HYPH|nr:non-homologous end-joining DNA ligase [Phyllobacterium endophyticum]MBB3237140.1 bifunctional non-homologous end joining protein LigD [Phyllobacterium endophyticum]PSH54633.1 ATP-dependent DNA ligase [Phyllobacterium endophyticum]TYR40600.1 ATP-dependent DNA ligase [Phyllobacterium endophyticum]
MAKTPRQSSQPLLRETERPLQSRPRKLRDPAQPQLLLDPMPERVEPCLASLKTRPPTGPDWLFEVKWDGYRLAIHIEPEGIRILTRGGHDWTHRFPAIAEAARSLDVATAIIDGEAVVFNERGLPDFGLLQQSLGGRSGKRASQEASFYAFDLLYFDGHDLRDIELVSRRHLLEGLIGKADGTIKFSETIEGDGDDLLADACEHGLEGIIAKRRASSYTSGRAGEWLKIKCTQSESFFIVGWEPSSVAFGGIGRLLLAAYKGNDLVFVGSVETGFNRRKAMALRKDLEKLKTTKPPVLIQKKGVQFVLPTLIAEIEFRAWTHDGNLRYASYKGLRDFQDNAAVCKI